MHLLEGQARIVLEELAGDQPVAGPPAGALRLSQLLAFFRSLRSATLEQLTDALGRELHTDALVALTARFDELTHERATVLAESQLTEARMALEAQSKYMSFLSHDLRGTLNSVILVLEVLRRELVSRPEFAESLTDIQLMRGTIMESVVAMELHLHADRLRRGKVEVHPTEVHLRELAQDAAAQAAWPDGQKPASIDIAVPEDAAITTDLDLLRQVLMAFLANAITHGQGKSVRLCADRRPEGWAISVSDQGPGLPQEKLDSFLDPVRRMQLKDRGMGLMIAQYAARLLGGRVEGESTPGAGTTVRVVVGG